MKNLETSAAASKNTYHIICNFFMKKNLLGLATSVTAPRLRLQTNISAALVLYMGCCIYCE